MRRSFPDPEPDALASEQVDAHADYVPMAVMGTVLVGGLLLVTLRSAASGPRVAVWLALLTLPFVWRYRLRARAHGTPDARDVASLLRQFRLSFALHGGVWGLVSVLLFPDDDFTLQALVAFIIGGFTATSLTAAAFDLTAGLSFLFLTVVPLSVRLYVEGGTHASNLGTLLTLYLGFMTVHAVRLHRHYVETFMLRREATSRAQSMTALQGAFGRLWQAEAGDTPTLLDAAAQATVFGLRLSRAVLCEFDHAGNCGRVLAAAGPGVVAPLAAEWPLDHLAPYEQALAAPVPLDRRAADADTVWRLLAGTPLALTTGAERIDVPMRVGARVAGVLACERTSGAWTDDERVFLASVAATVLAATEDARRRAAEGALRELNHDLERRIEERTRALHESEARFRALVDKSPVIFTLIALDSGTIVEMNELGLTLFGYRREEVIGRPAAELGLWANDAQQRHAARQIRDHGLVSSFEIELRRKSGDTFWALLSGTRVTLQGQPYVLATLQDITARRELETRMLQSQKMEVVGHLAGGIAHDFNNVLTVIASMAELGIEDTAPGEPAREALQTIRQASTRASNLTRQLLAFSRRQVLQPAPVDLNEMIAALEPIVRHAVSEKIDVRLNPAAGPSVVCADRNSLDQVVLNLSINARDAMPDGGTLELTVGSSVVEAHPDRPSDLAPGRYITLAVRDTGVGMTEATRRRVFEPFFTTKDDGKGTGLGLSVAHGIVAQSGGQIEVDSTLGAGTTFTLYLPEAATVPEAVPVASAEVATGRGRVLVVDDDADIRSVLSRALTFAGYEILAAGNGVEALDVLANVPAPVDLLLTDVMMPAMGGQELAQQVRQRYPSTRILFTSGYAENAIAHRGVLAAGVDFIAKPYSLQALAAKVREVMDRPAVN